MTDNVLNPLKARRDLIDAGAEEEFAEAIVRLSGKIVSEDVARKTLLDAGAEEKIAEAVVFVLGKAGKIKEPGQP